MCFEKNCFGKLKTNILGEIYIYIYHTNSYNLEMICESTSSKSFGMQYNILSAKPVL